VGFDDVVPSIAGEAGMDLAFTACSWFSTYRISHRSAERFRDRRCFLLGDAAHIHSPVGAQGMNTGLQDAYNLGWKLALVVAGRADSALLDSYESERIPVARRPASHHRSRIPSGRFGQPDRRGVAHERSWRGSPRARCAARRSSGSPFAWSRRSAFTTGRARCRSMSKKPPADAPRAGDRFPWLKVAFTPGGAVEDLFEKLDDTRFNLLVIGQPLPTDGTLPLGELLQVHPIPADGANAAVLGDAGIFAPSYYLLRPDGHIGLCGARGRRRRAGALRYRAAASQRRPRSMTDPRRPDTGAELRALYEPEGGVRALFSAKVADYVASRPDYPAALFDRLERAVPLSAARRSPTSERHRVS
jgi:hypothetical protein